MGNDPKVTVIIAAYNRETYIAKAIDSVRNQTMPDWRLIVVDDGSRDGTVRVVQSYVKDDERISLICSERNEGLGKTLQKGLASVTTPYFMTLDSDDWIERNTLEVLTGAMERLPQRVSLAYGNAVHWQEKPNGELEKLFDERNPSFHDKYDFIKYGPTPTPRFYRTDTVRALGGFLNDDPSGGRRAEDRYLLLRLIGVSDFHSVDIPLYHILHHGSNMTVPETRREFDAVKRFIYYRVLKEWGDEYEPIFGYSEDGWLDVVGLEPKENPTK